MLQEEEGTNHVGSIPASFGSWPPPGHQSNRPWGFMTKVSRGVGGRPVEWPPRSESQERLDQVSRQSQQPSSSEPAPPPVPPRPANYPQQEDGNPNLTTTYPSGFKLKDQPSFKTEPGRVVTSQPAFKITQPIRRRGDDKWPPKGSGEPTQEEVREFVRPKKSNRNYDEFFAQNALPHNYAGYRPPPGTQHHGLDEEDGVSNM